MRAMVIKDFGGPEVFEERDTEKPAPGPNDVLVKVHATSINPVDYKIRQAGSWAGIEPPAVIGYDVSGVVESVGSEVVDFEPGDEVYYTPEIFGGQGSYAEYHVADAAIVARKPESLTHEEAASIPLAGGTAWDAVVNRGLIEVGETILIHGAGGVGSLAIQIAVAAGARVYVTCSDYIEPHVKEWGGLPINYEAEDFRQIIADETGGTGVDMVLDTVGGDTMSKSIEITKPFGRMVNIVGTKADLSSANPSNITVHFLFLQRDRVKLDQLRTMVERGKLEPVIDSVMDLSDVAKAHQKLEDGGVRGKIVLKVA